MSPGSGTADGVALCQAPTGPSESHPPPAGTRTTTVAVSVCDAFAEFAATTWNVPWVAGAVYAPAAVIIPPPVSVTFQVQDPPGALATTHVNG